MGSMTTEQMVVDTLARLEVRIAALEKRLVELEAGRVSAKAAPGQTWKSPIFQRYDADEDK